MTNKYILFDGLTYNTHGYFASCVTSNEQNVRAYYMLNHRIRDLKTLASPAVRNRGINFETFWLVTETGASSTE